MKWLYKYPQRAYPYEDLVQTNRGRSKLEPEYELLDTGIFADDRYFDVFVEYVKASPEDILIRVTAENRGPEAATLHVLPTLWFRNVWSWSAGAPKPELREVPGDEGDKNHQRLTPPTSANAGYAWRATCPCSSQRTRPTTSGSSTRRMPGPS